MKKVVFNCMFLFVFSVLLGGCITRSENQIAEVPAVEPELEQTFARTIRVGAYKKSCVGVMPQDCLVVDGEYFYDKIEGFLHEDGTEYLLNIEQTQLCNPMIENDCPQDGGIYEYKLLEVLESAVAESFVEENELPELLEEISTEEPSRMAVTDFASCETVTGEVMESFPRKCAHNGEIFVERIEVLKLEPENSEEMIEEELNEAAACATQGGEMKPDGEMGDLHCIVEYSDGGKECLSSDECVGDCTVSNYEQATGICAFNNSPFGCKATIEAFANGDGIVCID